MYEVIMTNTQRAYTTALLQPLKKKIRCHEIRKLSQTSIAICIDTEIGETRQPP